MPDIIWRSTWPDADEDYIAMHGEEKLGRVYRNPAVRGQWLWFAWWNGAPTGSASSRRGAMLALEDGYREYLSEGGK